MRLASGLLWATLALAGCGDGGGDPAPPPDRAPRRIEGGGVADPGIDGALYVHVVDGANGTPVGGATVRVESARAPIVGMTSVDGLFRLERSDVRGPQTITIVAPDYLVTTWFGVDGANVTIPVDPSAPETTIPTAQARGTIAGWNELAAPADGHYLVAAVDYTRPRDLSSAENLVQQLTRGTMLANVCVRESAMVPSCGWTLETRVGRQLHFAYVLDGDRHGNEDATDDTFEVVAVGKGRPVELEAGQRLEAEQLELVDRELLATLEVELGPLPPGTAQVVGVPGVSTTDAGVMLVPTPLTPATPRARLPRLEGDLAGGNYWVIATATSAEPGSASSTIIRRNLTDTSRPVALGEWLPIPAPPTLTARTLAFAAVPGGTTYAVDLRTGGGLVVWRMAVLDTRTSLELPALEPDPLTANPDAMVLTASEVTFDRRAFALSTVRTELTRAAARTGRITR